MGVQAVEGSLLLLPDLIFFGFGPLGIWGRVGRLWRPARSQNLFYPPFPTALGAVGKGGGAIGPHRLILFLKQIWKKHSPGPVALFILSAYWGFNSARMRSRSSPEIHPSAARASSRSVSVTTAWTR